MATPSPLSPNPSATDNVYLRFIAEQVAEMAAKGGSTSFVFTQTTPALVWTIDHNLNRVVGVIIYDTTNTEVEGIATLINNNQMTIAFNIPEAGTALVL
jgi:hypothetical protein